MALEQQLQNLTLAYAPKERANKPRKLKNDITREMIDDYESELDKEKTFQPASLIPVLEKPNLLPAFTETNMIDFQRQIKGMGEDISKIEDAIPQIGYNIKSEDDFYNNFISDIDISLSSATGDRKKQLSKERNRAMVAYEDKTKKSNDMIGELDARKRQLESKIISLQKAYDENGQVVQSNAGEVERVRKLNQQNLKSVEDEIRALNQGFSINQQVGESEEDYLTRIQTMRDTKYSVSTQIDAETYNYKKLKKRLKDILNMADHKLSNVLKLLEQETLVYETNKKFPFVKSRIEKVIGLKSSPDETTLYNVIIEALKGTQEKEEEVTSTTSGDKQALMKLTIKQLKQIWFETTGTKTPKVNSKPLTRKQEIIDEIFRLQSLRPDLANVPRLSPEFVLNLNVKAREVKGKSPAKKLAALSGLKKGEGMHKLIGFGAIQISPSQLQLYNVLRVREPSKHSIRGLPDTKVSKDMVFILTKVLNGQIPSQTELNSLTPNERSIYDAVIFKAQLHTKVPHNADASIDDLKRRLSLLEGEVSAGNSNKDIKKELNSVIRQLIELRAITTQHGRNYLKQFTTEP